MVHNEYAARSGEEIQFDAIADLLSDRGNAVIRYTRNSNEIARSAYGKIKGFFAGIWNPWSRSEIRQMVRDDKPEVVFIQNLYPLISPSILPVIKEEGCPVVMRVANYRLMCPNGLHLSHGKVCEKCLGGKDYWCLLLNCEGDILRSAGYSLRNAVARVNGWYKENITDYICASSFLKTRLVSAGYPEERIHIIPNVVPDVERSMLPYSSEKAYAAYVGRISREKGIHVLISAARKCPDIQFRLAGRMSPSFRFESPLPKNVELVGFLSGKALSDFYARARLVVSSSECYETFGISVAEAMLHEKPVIASRIGVFPEFLQEGVTGMLAESGNADDLARKVRELWEQPDLCKDMGKAGRQRALSEYSAEVYYDRLMNVFMKATQHGHSA
jgi:glycosyltransferase involved in cell wall biosynthesis